MVISTKDELSGLYDGSAVGYIITNVPEKCAAFIIRTKNVKMGAEHFSETSVNFHEDIWHLTMSN
jgi:hypothetical protein